jgi:hypothetical protein
VLKIDDIIVDKKVLKDIIVGIFNEYSKIHESVDAIKSLRKRHKKI